MRDAIQLSSKDDEITLTALFNPVVSGLSFIVWVEHGPDYSMEITLAQFFQKLHITKEDCDRAFTEIPEQG